MTFSTLMSQFPFKECILLCKKPYRLVKLFVNISEPGLGFGDLCFGRSWRHNNSYEPSLLEINYDVLKANLFKKVLCFFCKRFWNAVSYKMRSLQARSNVTSWCWAWCLRSLRSCSMGPFLEGSKGGWHESYKKKQPPSTLSFFKLNSFNYQLKKAV